MTALNSANCLLTEVVLVGVSFLAILGCGLDQIARMIEKRVVRWSGKET
jgi:ABC-type nitrate/sulfonate/bicarbonate transport system permease component